MSAFLGSPEHRELLCRFFVQSHEPYDPAELPWPDLDEPARARLAALPIWEEAIRIEATTALVVRTMGATVRDPLFAEAISLQGYEEARHAELLRLLARKYGIAVPEFVPPPPRRPEWSFMRVGYGECFDSFFAFGLFALARDSGLIDPALVRLFERVMQEEGRHIIFHVNWVAYNQATLPFTRRPSYMFQRALAIWMQILNRCKTALRMNRRKDRSAQHFTLGSHSQFANVTPTAFVTLCMAENDRRLATYDARLLRPAFVPAMARAALQALHPPLP